MKQRWPAILTGIAAVWVLWTAGTYFFGGPRHRAESAWFVLVALAVAAAAMNGGSAPSADRPRAQRSVRSGLVLLAIVGVGLIVYAPATSLGLLSDDYVLLARSSRELVDPRAWEHFRPLPLFAWKVIYPVGGAAALHIVNVILGGVNAWMVGLLSRRLGHSTPVAALVTATFLFFPAAVEPIAWNSGIFDVAAVFFGLLFMLGATASSSTAQQLGLAALVAALLSKETAIVLPLIAMAFAWRADVNRRTLVVSVAIAAAYAGLRLVSGSDASSALLPAGSSLRYAIKEILVRPFATLGVPWTRTELTASTASRIVLGLLPVGVIVSLIVLYAVGPRRGLRPLTNVAWVFLGIAPLAGLFFVNDDLEGSRYLYLPLCGWCLLIGDLVNSIPQARLRLVCASALTVGVLLLGVTGIRHHLGAWLESAALRDRLVAEAQIVLRQSACLSPVFENVPSQHRGAQLFRNGFPQALGTNSSGDSDPACRFVWSGLRFERR
jgi:hypothetical protein